MRAWLRGCWSLGFPLVHTELEIVHDAHAHMPLIILMTIYSIPNSRKKTVLLDYISYVYKFMEKKLQEGTFWIIAGDTDDLKLDAILTLTPLMKQVVESPTQ